MKNIIAAEITKAVMVALIASIVIYMIKRQFFGSEEEEKFNPKGYPKPSPEKTTESGRKLVSLTDQEAERVAKKILHELNGYTSEDAQKRILVNIALLDGKSLQKVYFYFGKKGYLFGKVDSLAPKRDLFGWLDVELSGNYLLAAKMIFKRSGLLFM